MMNSYIVFFDGICNLCNSWVKFIIKYDKKNRFKFASLQSEMGQNFLKERNLSSHSFDSIILYQPNSAYFLKSDAVLQIFKLLGFPFSILSIFYIFPSFIRDKLYSLIAKNRYKFFGKSESCMMPNPEWKDKFLTN
ncbi:thiol-disulfide oxidoreductase DCC family protein [Apibacter muscae]|uniref:Thiol-disulfide oxidoreductase DCC family protein n=1 Tax=Apibacter muscae TaxID=2509004 RepID=A0A563DG14_9FLAO|nr:thiol-disulfide oxidoreductase DCC family protein [Apibacter muscae]TWP29135.1 thiol-disulfide oxidoreductase DCC family protein [Apibacter muscae]TWP30284.1 thiol-disulfide oxidoreductase DCC family protein [Apibacter muscae]